ncbi:MAG: HAD family hydrolase [Planctomycetota bacterium]|nr:MAG: HAD family hydrolase [Planctomycetota bacterium]REJ96109.1 MAG: HAD family hydrolase [Planctomycetota bacterium]
MSTMPQAILFDAVGTLLRPTPSVAEAYHAAGQRHGSRLTVAEIGATFDDAVTASLATDEAAEPHRTSEPQERQRWRAIVDHVFVDLKDDEPARVAIFEELWQHFASIESWSLFADVEPVWQELAGAEIVLGVASNFDARLRTIAAGLPPLDRCAHWFISSEVGYRKPAPNFFARAADALGLAAEQILLVGDDVENDYRAARAAGWQALLIDRRGDAATRHGLPEQHGLRRLTEVSQVLALEI